MNLQIALVVGSLDDIAGQGTLFADLLFDHQTHVHTVKDDKLLASAQIALQRLVFIDCPRQTEDQVAGKGEQFTRPCFVFLDKLLDVCNIHFEQAVHAVLGMRQVEQVEQHAAGS